MGKLRGNSESIRSKIQVAGTVISAVPSALKIQSPVSFNPSPASLHIKKFKCGLVKSNQICY